MTYIIDPMWFYWLHVLGNAKIIAAVASALSIVGGIACVVGYAICTIGILDYPNNCDTELAMRPIFKRIGIICWIVTGVLGLLHIFLPSKEVIIEMIVARYVTVENVELTVDGIKSAVEYIVRLISDAG